jgi:hypothetical protein
MRRRNTRRGYTTVLALVLIVLLLCLWGVAYRQTAAALRMETVQSNRVQRDQGTALALAAALRLLQTGTPPTNPYIGSVTETTSSGTQSFTITFTQEGSNDWAVQASAVAPGPSVLPLPATFGP